MTPDIAVFEAHVTRIAASLAQRGRPLFSASEAPLTARAPGRLDVMGGIADYSGSLTLELPLGEAAFVSVQPNSRSIIRIVSAGFGPDAPPLRDVSWPADELSRACRSYAGARAYFGRQPEHAWTAYVAGALVALRIEENVELFGGLDILVCSSVPEGKGVSSSAAIEVASLRALAALGGLSLEPVRVALSCQRIENLVVGAPCGIMDQMTSSCGSAGQLLPIVCQPAHLQPGLEIPAELGLWGIDSCIRHQVSGADYTEVRVAAFMGYTIIARVLGLPVRPGGKPGKLEIDDARYRGYLANVGVELFEQKLVQHLPERLSGDAFLQTYGGIIDPITDVVPDRSYRVRAATAHPVYEHARATEFRRLMQSGPGGSVGPRLGELMYLAHDSYGACGLGSAGTDRLVALVREAGLAQGLYGAKITGGGSGGTVAVLGARHAEPVVRGVVQTYARETGFFPQLFAGSSAGAAEFGIARLQREDGSFRLRRGAPLLEAAAERRERSATEGNT
jgi:galactokinase